MESREAFIDKILSDPYDNNHRLVYADWLDENNEADRAEFIRTQIALATLNSEEHCPECGEHWKYSITPDDHWVVGPSQLGFKFACEREHTWTLSRTILLKRERELLSKHRMEWDPAGDKDSTFRRGFITKFQCSLSEFLYTRNIDKILGLGWIRNHLSDMTIKLFRENPIEEVGFVGLTPIQIGGPDSPAGGRATWNWYEGRVENESPYRLPPFLYRALHGGEDMEPEMGVNARSYPSREEAQLQVRKTFHLAIPYARKIIERLDAITAMHMTTIQWDSNNDLE